MLAGKQHYKLTHLKTVALWNTKAEIRIKQNRGGGSWRRVSIPPPIILRVRTGADGTRHRRRTHTSRQTRRQRGRATSACHVTIRCAPRWPIITCPGELIGCGQYTYRHICHSWPGTMTSSAGNQIQTNTGQLQISHVHPLWLLWTNRQHSTQLSSVHYHTDTHTHTYTHTYFRQQCPHDNCHYKSPLFLFLSQRKPLQHSHLRFKFTQLHL